MKEKEISNDIISKKRSILMGISIVLIIIFHFTEDCKIYEFQYEGWIRWFGNYLGSSSVDTFLFLSGLGLYYSMKKNPNIREFYKRRFTKILIPYVLVAIPAWIWKDFIVEKLGMPDFIKDFTFVTLKSGTRWYWYIAMILICYLIFPYIFRIVEGAKDAIEGEMYFISLVGIITLVILLVKLYAKDTYSNIEIVLTRFPIFIAGCFYGKSSYEQRRSYWKWACIFFIAVIGVYLISSDTPILGRYVRGMLNVSACALFAVVLSGIKSGIITKIWECFGTLSLELYLTHVTVRKVMKEYGYFTCYVRYELIMVAISIVLAWILHKVCQQIQLISEKKDTI